MLNSFENKYEHQDRIANSLNFCNQNNTIKNKN